jgi:hypothetical protein
MTILTLDDVLPTDEEVAAYWRDGFHVTRQVLPDEVLDAAELGMARFYTGDHDALFPGSTPYDSYDWRPEHGDVIRKNDYTSIQVRELAALTRSRSSARSRPSWPGHRDPALARPAALQAGRPGLAAGNVGWHTDRQYWQTCTSEAMLTGWVPFHDCDATVGGVTFVRGSHLWEQGRLDFWNTDLDALEAQFASEGRPVDKVTPVLPRGSMTFHHCRTIHGSGPNLSAAPRRSVAVHLQPDDNRTSPHRPWRTARRRTTATTTSCGASTASRTTPTPGSARSSGRSTRLDGRGRRAGRRGRRTAPAGPAHDAGEADLLGLLAQRDELLGLTQRVTGWWRGDGRRYWVMVMSSQPASCRSCSAWLTSSRSSPMPRMRLLLVTRPAGAGLGDDVQRALVAEAGRMLRKMRGTVSTLCASTSGRASKTCCSSAGVPLKSG